MRRFIKTGLLILGFALCSMTTNSTSNAEELLYIANIETPEEYHLRQSFDISLKDRWLIKHYPAISPINPKDITRISSFYGERIHPIYESKHIHQGIDLAAPEATPVLATGSGEVRSVKESGWGYGLQIVIGHDDEYTTRYAHLSKILVSEGDLVSQGDTIGEVGSTGLSTGNHLHYEISHHHERIDPLSIYPDTLQESAYLDYLQNVNDYYTSCSDFLFNI